MQTTYPSLDTEGRMNEQIAIEHLVREVQRYASGRGRGVERGAETPRLAALLLQKYGLGESPRATDPILYALDAETKRIDPTGERIIVCAGPRARQSSH